MSLQSKDAQNSCPLSCSNKIKPLTYICYQFYVPCSGQNIVICYDAMVLDILMIETWKNVAYFKFLLFVEKWCHSSGYMMIHRNLQECCLFYFLLFVENFTWREQVVEILPRFMFHFSLRSVVTEDALLGWHNDCWPLNPTLIQ